MLENPSTLESPRDPFSALWWTESSFDRSPCRNSSFARVNCNLRRLKESDGRGSELEFSLDRDRKKLTWISREDYKSSSAQKLAGSDRQSKQNAYVQGRSARFEGTDSPRSGIHNPAESPVRRGESVRRIRTPSMDFDTSEVPSSATASRRLRSLNRAPRSASFKEGSGGAGSAFAKGDHNVVKEASAIWRGLTSTVHDQRTASKSRVPHAISDEHSPRIFPSSMDAPETDRLVISYLAEETDRIIKERIQKYKFRCHPNAADQPPNTYHARISAGEAMRTSASGRRLPHFDKTKAERVTGTYDDMDRDEVRVGDRELGNDLSNSTASSMPDSPSLPISPLLPRCNTLSTSGEGAAPPPTQMNSASMESYLDNRRRGPNMGSPIIVHPRPGARKILSPAASFHSNIAVLRPLSSEPENPSTSTNVNRVGRGDSFIPLSRAALSPINGNEDVILSTTSLSHGKEELYSSGELPITGEDSNIRRSDRNESPDAVQQQMQQEGENGFPSRLQYWADFLGNGGEIDCGESALCHSTKESEERTSPSGRKELGKKIARVLVYSNGAHGGLHFSQQERRPIGGSARHSAATRGLLRQTQRYEPEVGKSLVSDKVLGVGPRDKNNASRRSQSCRRDSIIKSLLDSSQENEPCPPTASRNKQSALPSVHDISSDTKNSSKSSVNTRVSSSRDTLPKPYPFLSQIEKQKFLFKDSPYHESSSKRISTAGPKLGATPLSSSSIISVAGPHELGRNPLSLSSRRSLVAGHESGGNLSSSSRRLPVAGHEAARGNPLLSSRSLSVAASPESGRSPLVSYSEPLQRPKSSIQTEIDKSKLRRMDTASQTKSDGPFMESPMQDSQVSAKKKNSPRLDRPKMSHRTSLSLDQQDVYKKLFVQTKDNHSSQPTTTSTSVSQACLMPSPMTVAKPQIPSSPGSSFQRWLANHFRLGSKARSSSTGKDRVPQEEPKPRKKSPWRTKPAEVLQGIIGKKGSSTRPPPVPLVNANSLQNSREGNSSNSDTTQ